MVVQKYRINAENLYQVSKKFLDDKITFESFKL